MRSTRTRLAAVALTAGLALTACGSDTEEEASDTVSAATSEAAEAGSDATDAAGDAASDATSAAGDAADSAEEGLSDAGSSITSGASDVEDEAEEATNDTYSMAQVKEHATEADCWSVIDGTVYDLTAWTKVHPGGETPIKGLCGTDGTADFKAQHEGEDDPEEKLEEFKLGVLKG